MCRRCGAGGGNEKGGPGVWLSGAQPGPRWEPFHRHPPLPWDKQQLHPGDQDLVPASFEAISCSCCCALHPHSPRASLDGEVPISHPASGRVPRLHAVTHYGGKRRRASPGAHTRAKAPFFHPCHKPLCQAQPCKTTGDGTCSVAGWACTGRGAPCSLQEQSPLARHLRHCWGSAAAAAALAARGATLLVPATGATRARLLSQRRAGALPCAAESIGFFSALKH